MELALRIAIALLVAITPGSATLAASPERPVCGEREDIRNKLERDYSEHVIGHGVSRKGQLFEVFVSPDGTWSAVVTRPDGKSCLQLYGDSWTTALPPSDLPREVPTH